MCLYITKEDIIPKIATKDIVCYKVIVYKTCNFNENKGNYYTAFQHERIKLGKRVKAEYNKEITKVSGVSVPGVSGTQKYRYRIDGGQIHSVCTLTDAISLKLILHYTWRFSADLEPTIVKCVIPKGTKYHKGMFGFFENIMASYCSDEIIYDDKTYDKDIVTDLS